jgi:hypothetical protein
MNQDTGRFSEPAVVPATKVGTIAIAQNQKSLSSINKTCLWPGGFVSCSVKRSLQRGQSMALTFRDLTVVHSVDRDPSVHQCMNFIFGDNENDVKTQI